MAQTIKIKRSTGSSAPSTLANGELAYLNNSTTKKLYIGRPGGGTGDIDVIGGKDFTDKLDLIGAANGTNAADASVVASANNLGVIRIGAGLSIATNGEVSADEVTATSVTNAGALMDSEVTNLAQVKSFSSSDYATAAQGTLATNALPKAGGTLTGDIVLGDDNKVQFGDTTTNLEIYNDGTTSYIKENASGNLEIHATDFTIKDGGGQTMMSFDADGVLRLYDQQTTNPSEKLKTQTTGIYVTGTMNSTGIKLGNETVTISSIKDEDTMSSNSATALATQQSIKAYVDASVPTSVATATTATNVTLSADNSTNASHFIPFANSATGNQGLQTDNALSYNPSTNGLSVGTSGNIATGTLSVYSTISGPSTLYIDPSPDDTGEVGGSTTDTGTVVILGDLRVTGETFTVNSTTVTVGDNIIRLNADLASDATPTHDAGIEVDRGGSADVGLFWDESASQWVVSDASGVSPYQYPILQTRTAHLQTYTIDGGSF